jgi:PASTA domain
VATRMIPFQEGMKVGFGYDLVGGTPSSGPAVRGTLSSIQKSGGQQVVSHLVRVTDLASLHEELGVNVDAGGSYFGASADVKVGFAKECGISSYSLHVVVGVTVVDAFQSFDDPVLTDEAADLIRLKDTPRFHARFGDVFIDGVRRGGEYFAVIEISSSDESTREDIAVQVEAAYNSFALSAHLDVGVKSSKSSSSAHTEVRIHIYRNGAVGAAAFSLEEVLSEARAFPPSVQGDLAAPFAVSLADYTTLNLPSDGFSFIDVENQREVLAEHALKRFQFLKLLNDISHILLNPTDFVDVNRDTLERQQAQVTDAINTMEREASACVKNPGACQFTRFDVSDFPLPPVALVAVPDLTDMAIIDALRLAVKNGLIPVNDGPSPTPDSSKIGLIMSQNPAAGIQIRKGARVKIQWGSQQGESPFELLGSPLAQRVKSDFDSVPSAVFST